MATAKQFIAMPGLDEKRQPQAAKFDLSDADVTRKAAQLMGLSTAIPKTEERRGLMAKIAEDSQLKGQARSALEGLP